MRRKNTSKIKRKKDSTSIFKEYYSDNPFYDQFAHHPNGAVDVIIPIIHTNELWETNLKSFYREIPINRLLIGDGGCIDDSIKIVKKFPRVKIFNHRKYISLGYSIRKLIEEVETEWFIYSHSDIYLPKGWFEKMRSHQRKFDWFGCPMQMTVMAQWPNVDKIGGKNRPYAGSQMGRKIAFEEGIKRIDDDYVYRQEDFVFADIVETAGFKIGAIEDTFHYHQLIKKPSPWERKITTVSVSAETTKEEKIRTSMTQVKGIIKYLKPSSYLSLWVANETANLFNMDAITWPELKGWIAQTNPCWLGYLSIRKIKLIMMVRKIKKIISLMFRI